MRMECTPSSVSQVLWRPGENKSWIPESMLPGPSCSRKHLPALAGYDTLQNSRCLIDCNKDQVFMMGPGEYNLLEHLPPGSRLVETERATTGHLMMPIDHYQEFHDYQNRGGLDQEEMVLVQDQPKSSKYADRVEEAIKSGAKLFPLNQFVPKDLTLEEA